MSTKVLMNGRLLTTLVMLVIFVIMTVLAFDFPSKGRLMPLMVGIPAVLLGLIQLILDYRAASANAKSGTATDSAPEKQEKAGKKGEYQMILWTTLFFAGIVLFGFVVASPVLVFAFLYFGSKESIKVSLISAVCTWAVIYFTFVKWFQISLFSGLILEWLFG
jgi:hypothetical protein